MRINSEHRQIALDHEENHQEDAVTTMKNGATVPRMNPRVGPGLRIDPLRLLAGCRKRRLSQALLNLRGLI